jgi:hypothetical protein
MHGLAQVATTPCRGEEGQGFLGVNSQVKHVIVFADVRQQVISQLGWVKDARLAIIGKRMVGQL